MACSGVQGVVVMGAGSGGLGPQVGTTGRGKGHVTSHNADTRSRHEFITGMHQSILIGLHSI